MTASEFSLAILCLACGKAGIAVWREDRNEGAGIRCEIVSLSEGFRQNGRDPASGDTQILCDCGALVPG